MECFVGLHVENNGLPDIVTKHSENLMWGNYSFNLYKHFRCVLYTQSSKLCDIYVEVLRLVQVL